MFHFLPNLDKSLYFLTVNNIAKNQILHLLQKVHMKEDKAKLQPLLSPHHSSLCLLKSQLYKAIPIISYKNTKNSLNMENSDFFFLYCC